MNRYISNIALVLWMILMFVSFSNVFRNHMLSDFFHTWIFVLPILLLSRSDSFFKRAAIMGACVLVPLFSIPFVGLPPSSGDGMEIMINMFYGPGICIFFAFLCFLFGIVSKLIPQFKSRDRNIERIRNFKGEWIIIIFIITIGMFLMKEEYFPLHKTLNKPLSVPKYEIHETGKTKKVYVALFENGFGYNFDKNPTEEQVENIYKERIELSSRTPAVKYEKHIFYGVYTDIGRIQIYRKKIGRFILLFGYPIYILIMFVFYGLTAKLKRLGHKKIAQS
ncbi:MAG: hypothetical protein PHQ52_07930 [Candidatus Omnitrophica bacterium]|nr:hypothetical protein [Candidatus Omnitrophota bacterium]